jgi:hypothetical protein
MCLRGLVSRSLNRPKNDALTTKAGQEIGRESAFAGGICTIGRGDLYILLCENVKNSGHFNKMYN